MGKQSARLYYDRKDHKDIYFQGQYHEKMCKGNSIVWEKLYPDAYFVGNGAGENAASILAKEYADTRKSLVTWYYYVFTENTIALSLIGYKNGKGGDVFFTTDLIHFKSVDEFLSNLYGTIRKKYFFRNYIINVDERQEYSKTPVSYPNLSELSEYSSRCMNFGNYGVLSKSYRLLDSGTYTYLIVDENGEVTSKKDVVSITAGNNTAQESCEKLAMASTTSAPYGYGVKIVFGNYIYYAVNGSYDVIQDNIRAVSGRIIRRNLLSFEREIIYDFGIPSSRKEVSISFVCYRSYKKIIAVCYEMDKTDNVLHPYLLTIDHNTGSSLKPINKLAVNIYRKNEKINIIPVRTSKDIEDNSLYLFYNYMDNKGTSYHGTDNFLDSFFPAMKNGVVGLDSVGGMAVAFGSTTLGKGYVYFDNLDFSASENNYVYFI